MSDLVSRNAVMNRIENEYRKWGDEYDVPQILGDIEDLPSAEPKKGKWKVTPCYIKCSECGECFMLIPQNFCPACGARMEADHETD